MLAMMRRRPSEEAGGERSMSELPAISLFSGAGGLDLGVERAGYRITVALDYDRDSCETLRAKRDAPAPASPSEPRSARALL